MVEYRYFNNGMGDELVVDVVRDRYTTRHQGEHYKPYSPIPTEFPDGTAYCKFLLDASTWQEEAY